MPARIVLEVVLDLQGKTLAEAEADLMGQIRAGLGSSLQAEVNRVAAQVPSGPCPTCGRGRRRRGKERRRLVGLFGGLELERQRVNCRQCRQPAYPADAALGLPPADRYTLGVAEASW